ncbi:hypothetical protein [Microcoleus sp. bin38.metabat.b11b12b14.051]|uniref:hypothetical protein n=1 Tax=Microcoleus sp. bin38.metabat.b11b12b14.051 TaxID=2742709 RepID=UPI0025DD2F51|nr:hypothetical protein [Microcoleus sp. bin38.metabat.b11b12b14.051]
MPQLLAVKERSIAKSAADAPHSPEALQFFLVSYTKVTINLKILNTILGKS